MPPSASVCAVSRSSRQLGFVSDDPHSASTAAGCGLDDHRKADLESELYCFVWRFDRIGLSRQDRHAGGLHRSPSLDLVAHHRDHSGRGR